MKEGELGGWKAEQAVRVVEHGERVDVIVKGQRYMRWALGDEGSQRMAIVQLYEQGLGTYEQLAEAFGVHVNSVQKYVTSFAAEGSGGLLSQPRGPRRSWKVTPRLRSRILLSALREGCEGVKAIQQQMRDVWHEELSEPSIRAVLSENGLVEGSSTEWAEPFEQGELFAEENGDGQLDLRLSAPSDAGGERGSGSIEREPWVETRTAAGGSTRPGKRYYSAAQREYLERLEQGDYNTYAGGLLFVPLLERYGFLAAINGVIELSTHEGYSLDEMCVTLLYMQLFGFQSMEDFKRAYPEEFGLLAGRAQSPSVYSLRRFLHRVRRMGKGEALMEAFARRYLAEGLVRWGVLYIDGHFLPYYGQYPISKGWHGVRQIAMKGSYHFLAVDEEFWPWLFLVRSSAEDLLQKIPELIGTARRLHTAAVSAKATEPLVVLFDREGYSAQLYRQLDGREEGHGTQRVIFISWAKYADRWVHDEPDDRFEQAVRVEYQIKRPERIRYFETTRSMNKYGKIRTLVIESGRDKRRAAIYTNGTEEEIGAQRVVQLMCRRWGEENRIKELLHRHQINYTPGYVLEEMEQQPWVDNPKVKELKKERARLQAELRAAKVLFADEVRRQQLEHADAQTVTSEALRPLESIVRTENEILKLNNQLGALPQRVRFDEAHDGRQILALNYEKKRFLDGLKVFACNMRRAMGELLLPYYDCAKEIQPALSMIVERAGHVKLEGGTLRVRLRRFHNREIGYAARRLCEELNAMRPVTPDRFRLPLQYEVS